MTSKLTSSYSNGSTSSFASRDEPQSQSTNVTIYFAEHLIAEILCCLPVKTLLRFRCVSKLWCSLIDSPRFVKSHLKRSIESKTNTGVIIGGHITYSVPLDFGSLDNATAVEIDEPLKTLLRDTQAVGSCNGLHCLFNIVVDMFLWNPATRKCIKLPPVPTEFRGPLDFGRGSYCGFGYDAVNDDYKVLRILRPDDKNFSGYKVTVYSLKNNSWRRLQDLSSYFGLVGPWGMFVGGAVHWITVKPWGSEICPSILAFDVGAENYKELQMPRNIGEEMSLGIFAESLCITEFHLDIHINVWVMKDYGVGNSWYKLFSLEQQKVSRSGISLSPLAYSKNQKDVLTIVDNKKMIWYNLERKDFKTIKIANAPDVYDIEVFTESLVSPDYNTSDRKQVQKQPQEKQKLQKQQKKNKRDNFLSKGFKLVL
ncbi:F-box protein CPR1-like [Apium graveolens]|uniref:F-box protein CPR1-like n=1 Tax=Apium graveolens TaxID=4045 RepID=UPI003D7A0E0B